MMNSRSLTITLIILILLAVLWTRGGLQKILNAALGN
jgi:hypothetical protein